MSPDLELVGGHRTILRRNEHKANQTRKVQAVPESEEAGRTTRRDIRDKYNRSQDMVLENQESQTER